MAAEVSIELEPSIESEIALAKRQLSALIDSHALDALDGIIERFNERGERGYARELELICEHPAEVGPHINEQLRESKIEIGVNVFSPQQQMIQDREQKLRARLMFDRRTVPHSNKFRLRATENLRGETAGGNLKVVTDSYSMELEPIAHQLSPADEEERGEQFNAVTIEAISAPGNEIDLRYRPEIATTYKQGNTNNVPTVGILMPGGSEIRLNRLAWKDTKRVQDATITTYNYAKMRTP